MSEGDAGSHEGGDSQYLPNWVSLLARPASVFGVCHWSDVGYIIDILVGRPVSWRPVSWKIVNRTKARECVPAGGDTQPCCLNRSALRFALIDAYHFAPDLRCFVPNYGNQPQDGSARSPRRERRRQAQAGSCQLGGTPSHFTATSSQKVMYLA